MKNVIFNLIIVLTVITSIDKANDFFICSKYTPMGNNCTIDYNTQYLIEGIEDLEEGDVIAVSVDNGNINDISYVGWMW